VGSPAGRIISQLGLLQWASRNSDVFITDVELQDDGVAVTVQGPGASARRDRVPYGVAEVTEALERVGLARPDPGDEPPPGEFGTERPWQHWWAELLYSLGRAEHALREIGQPSTRRLAAIRVDEEHVATVVVMDDSGQRWITSIPLAPLQADVTSAGYDIATWIARGQGRLDPDGSLGHELSWG
jgi:hypothetical protein